MFLSDCGIECIFYDFDGVMTDNCVWVREDGVEEVKCNRSDGLAVKLISEMGIDQVIVSTEENPIVVHRAKKMGIKVYHHVDNKASVIESYCDEKGYSMSNTMFVGNDINDLPAFDVVKIKGCPADAEEEIVNSADWISKSNGGDGVVRDLYRCLVQGVE